MKIFPHPVLASRALLQRSIIAPDKSSTGPFPEKKPALRRQRILWRRRVGDASAKPTSAVKFFETCDFITVLNSIPAACHRNKRLHSSRSSPAQSEDLFLHFES